MRFFKKFKCGLCDKKLSSHEQLMQHQQTAHYSNTPYDCKECNIFFSSMEQMRTHLQKKHSYKKTR
ncbi:MAG: hypothetical protein GWN01_06655 [Nitrosopumilaceae archaeon]|nr:hypothetical protein [Nitrosopumilaceae archaeon]NIU00615.1 hypothetical protein [Nitrosopumilaceae archaeon]NIU87001.1 hypothetical protein [Nitrosopumilaceae archaeon]NIV66465.1 hypothetical protein [Nitrosopumilaceae archaeon]NIX61217.1 hypothetical protein [Nitrosopumilaceae archaeon]